MPASHARGRREGLLQGWTADAPAANLVVLGQKESRPPPLGVTSGWLGWSRLLTLAGARILGRLATRGQGVVVGATSTVRQSLP